MKDLSELKIPEDLRYSEDHEWARVEGENVRVGITDYAQDQLGDVVFVELPQAGTKFSKGDVFGSVESVKAVSELFLPFGGEVAEANTHLEEAPDLVNSSPYEEGWMVVVKPSDPSEVEAMLSRDRYVKTLKESE